VLKVTPRLLQELDPDGDRTRRAFEALGVTSDELEAITGAHLVLTVGPAAHHRRLAAVALDLVARLQPLVRSVYLDADDPALILGDLATRLPVDVTDSPAPDDAIRVGVGISFSECDLVVDANDWAFAIGELITSSTVHLPFGTHAGAAIVVGEIFKLAFAAAHPASPLSARLQPSAGVFSLWDYTATTAGPPVDHVELDVVLVGVGGVGAGFVCTIGDLAGILSGTFTAVDADTLTLHNLNRVLYATVGAAQRGAKKLDEVDRYLRERLPTVALIQRAEDYTAFKKRIPRRQDRRMPVVVTGVDNDDVRWEVQRDLPRVLIDAATGSQMNCVIQRVDFLDSGCVGCARPPHATAPPIDDLECDAPPATSAPSISFLSYFAGVVAAAEAVKAATFAPSAATYYEHVFTYGPNPDLSTTLAKHACCPVQCAEPAVADAYLVKWV
jgi:hypothetical protein